MGGGFSPKSYHIDLHNYFNSLGEGETHDAILTYTIMDGDGVTDTTDITLTITGVNDAPVADDMTRQIDEDGAPKTFSFAASDPDFNDMTYVFDSQDGAGTFTNNNDGTFTYSRDGNFDNNVNDGGQTIGTVTVNYTATDTLNLSDSGVITINVIGVDDGTGSTDGGNVF